eukprot:11203384-Lingulodinium_polyedra.AAC.1
MTGLPLGRSARPCIWRGCLRAVGAPPDVGRRGGVEHFVVEVFGEGVAGPYCLRCGCTASPGI